MRSQNLERKTLTFADADTDTNAGGSAIALPDRCSGKLKMEPFFFFLLFFRQDVFIISLFETIYFAFA